MYLKKFLAAKKLAFSSNLIRQTLDFSRTFLKPSNTNSLKMDLLFCTRMHRVIFHPVFLITKLRSDNCHKQQCCSNVTLSNAESCQLLISYKTKRFRRRERGRIRAGISNTRPANISKIDVILNFDQIYLFCIAFLIVCGAKELF